MKVGTDGVLLGAWASVDSCRSVLDVGTGTGLIALMIAQRTQTGTDPPIRIDAVDIDADAVRQAERNAAASPFAGRIAVYLRSFEAYAAGCPERYDLIVSNPPYFSRSLKCPDEKRSTARHNDSLPPDRLLAGAARLLAPHGRLALILPADVFESLKNAVPASGLHPVRITFVSSVEGQPPKRVLAEYAPVAGTQPVCDSLAIETQQHVFTPEYVALTRDFYLKM